MTEQPRYTPSDYHYVVWSDLDGHWARCIEASALADAETPEAALRLCQELVAEYIAHWDANDLPHPRPLSLDQVLDLTGPR